MPTIKFNDSELENLRSFYKAELKEAQEYTNQVRSLTEKLRASVTPKARKSIVIPKPVLKIVAEPTKKFTKKPTVKVKPLDNRFNNVLIRDFYSTDESIRVEEYRKLIGSVDLYEQEDYDCTRLNVWGYRSANDIRDGINIKFGNMCNGFPFEINGVKFHNSECAYITGVYARKDQDCLRIQKLVVAERIGMKCKRIYRNKPEFTKHQRKDFYEYNVQWMLYVLWQKTRGNHQFADLLANIPINAHVVENTSYHKGATASFWGAKNPELMTARVEAEKDVSPSTFKFKYQVKEAMEEAANSINAIGHFRGQNVMGKIIKLCSLAVIYGQEPEIDYDLLKSKELYLLGEPIEFPG